MSPDAVAVRAQVERVVKSQAFETSEIHRRLLHYLAEKSLSGEADRLKEYVIGLEAFGKPPSYDPRHDSIVRLQVGRLRQKLQSYYQSEAAADEIHILIPKGGFKLNFEPAPAHGHGTDSDASTKLRRLVIVLAVVLVAVAVWAVLATTWLVRAREDVGTLTAERWTPELEALWGPFLQSKRPFLLCMGTPLFLRFPDRGFFRDPKTNDWADIGNSARITAIRKSLGDRDMIPAYTFTGVGEANAVFLIAKLLSTRMREMNLTRSSILSWQQVTDNNLVFVGPPKFNLQLQAPVLTQDIVVEPEGVRNLRPQPGEPVFLRDHTLADKQSEGETHAVISRMPGLSGVGELLILGGNASSDTFAAAEWLTESWRARELVRRLRLPSGEMPLHYQVVLKVAFKQGIPVKSSYVYHHVLDIAPRQPGKQ